MEYSPFRYDFSFLFFYLFLFLKSDDPDAICRTLWLKRRKSPRGWNGSLSKRSDTGNKASQICSRSPFPFVAKRLVAEISVQVDG